MKKINKTKHILLPLAAALVCLLAVGCEREYASANSEDICFKGVLRWEAHPHHTNAARPLLVWALLTDDGQTLILEEEGHFLKAGAAPIGGEEYAAGDTVEFSGTLRSDRDLFGTEIQILSLPALPNLNHLIFGTWKEIPGLCQDVVTFHEDGTVRGGQIPFELKNGFYRVVGTPSDTLFIIHALDSLGVDVYCVSMHFEVKDEYSKPLMVLYGHPGCFSGGVDYYRYFNHVI